MDGIEHRRSKKRLILNLVIIALILICIIMIAIRWNQNQSLNNIEIIGNKIIPTEELRNYIVSILNAIPKEKIKLEQISSEISKHIYVSKAYVTKDNPQKIKIEIIEKKPIAIVAKENGELFFLDKENNILPYNYIEKVGSLPILSGVFKDNILDTMILKDALKIINTLNNSFESILFEVSEIYFSKKDSNWYLNLENHLQFNLGKVENLEKKLNYAYFVNKFFSENSLEKNQNIDLRWLNHLINKL